MRSAAAGVERSRQPQPQLQGLTRAWSELSRSNPSLSIKVLHDRIDVIDADAQVIDSLSINEMPQDPRSMRQFRHAVLSIFLGDLDPFRRLFGLSNEISVASFASVSQIFATTEMLGRLHKVKHSTL